MRSASPGSPAGAGSRPCLAFRATDRGYRGRAAWRAGFPKLDTGLPMARRLCAGLARPLRPQPSSPRRWRSTPATAALSLGRPRSRAAQEIVPQGHNLRTDPRRTPRKDRTGSRPGAPPRTTAEVQRLAAVRHVERAVAAPRMVTVQRGGQVARGGPRPLEPHGADRVEAQRAQPALNGLTARGPGPGAGPEEIVPVRHNLTT
jgi:hypothetical protein